MITTGNQRYNLDKMEVTINKLKGARLKYNIYCLDKTEMEYLGLYTMHEYTRPTDKKLETILNINIIEKIE